MKKKVCFKCGCEKKINDFYKHPKMKFGLGKCKECAKKDVSENYKIKKKQYQKYEKERERERTKERKQKKLEYQRRYRKNHRDREIAHRMVNKAIKNKTLKKMPCEVCGTKKTIEGHHDDYSKPLSIRWLCFKHHREHHMEQLKIGKI